MTLVDGLKVRVKTRLVRAVRAGLSDEFWHSIDDSVDDLDPRRQVLDEFPVERMAFPILRVGVSFDQSTWLNMNRYFVNARTQPDQVGQCKVRCTIDLWARDAKQRDRMEDALLLMLIFQYTRPKNVAFVRELDADPTLGLQPVLNSIRMGADSSTNRIPWNIDTQVYTGSLSFDLVCTYQLAEREVFGVIREIDAHILDENGDEMGVEVVPPGGMDGGDDTDDDTGGGR